MIKNLYLIFLITLFFFPANGWSQEMSKQTICKMQSISIAHTVQIFYKQERSKPFIEGLMNKDLKPNAQHLVGIAYDAFVAGKDKATAEQAVYDECIKLNVSDLFMGDAADANESEPEVCNLAIQIVLFMNDKDLAKASLKDFMLAITEKLPHEAPELFGFVEDGRSIYRRASSPTEAERLIYEHCDSFSTEKKKKIEEQLFVLD